MKYEFAALTDVGRVRHNNEDSVRFSPELGLVVLADGMGGYNAGEVASGMTTALFESEMSRHLEALREGKLEADDLGDLLREALQHINAQVFDAAHSHAQYAGMGTTVVAGMLLNDDLVLAHLGDSRAYLLREEELIQITRDHSMLQEYLDMGLITPEQAPLCAWKNLVTRAIGVEQQVHPDITVQPVQTGDIVMLCSDGLSDMLTPYEITEMLKNRNNSLQARASHLIEAANAAGGKDNISVILVETQMDASKQGLAAQLGRIFSRK